MPFLQVNPRYRDLVDALDLRAPEEFLTLPAVVVSGHPERNVSRTALGSLPAFLKREHRVRWRDRLGSWRAGFGFVTRSQREAMTLQALERAGIACPDWIAYGEDGRGRAFLLTRALTDAAELRSFLRDSRLDNPRKRLAIARRLGIALARMHDAGFDHPDLYSKHVFLDANGDRIYFLDWQRSRRGPVDERRRIRDLAALDATLTLELASERERWACCCAYHEHRCNAPATRFSTGERSPRRHPDASSCKRFAHAVRRASRRLLRNRHVRQARLLQSTGARELIWLDDEALCITPQFLRDLNGAVPEWLRLERNSWGDHDSALALVALPGGRHGLLVRRRRDQPLRWLWSEFRRKPLTTPEVRQAGMLFRRQGQGQPAPRLLAFGQRRLLPWRTESFLLTEVPIAEDEGSP
jgi:tRNA A-37 threonylcarbamoyl transferase component Bud32